MIALNSGEIRSRKEIPVHISDQPVSVSVKINIVHHISETPRGGGLEV